MRAEPLVMSRLVSAWDEPVVTDAAEVGGKAASLFRMLQLGLQVPPFFVITAAAHRTNASGKVETSLRAEIGESLQRLGGDSNAYAVRSSGLAEDSADFSYAGVFETILDVRGLDNVVAAVERCWASHRSAIAAAYREQRGVVDDAAMAVVVQRMVAADWAGVSFSADPLTQSLSVAVINAAPGLGEALVSGHVNPEEIRLDALTGRIIDRRIPANTAPFPDELRAAVLQVTQRAAQASGFPQDLEWAVQDGALYLLQSRPITTLTGVFHNRALEPWQASGTPDDPERVWTRAYADEIWTPPVSPLFYDIQNLTAATSAQIRNGGDDAPLPPDIFKYYRAASYMDAAVLVRLYASQPPVARRPSLFDLLPPEYRPTLAVAPWNWRGALRRLWRFEVEHGKRRGVARNHRFLEQSWPAFVTEGQRLGDVNISALNDIALEQHLGEVWALAGSVGAECEVAVLYYAQDIKLLLSGLLERWCGAGEDGHGEVSAGLDDSITVAEADAIWSIGQSLRAANGAAMELARSSSWETFSRRAKEAVLTHVVADFEAFLYKHRHRGANYKDLIHRRWGDDPELLWSHVQAFVEPTQSARRPRDANAVSAHRRHEAQKRFLARPRGLFAFLKRFLLRRLFRWNELYAGLRDNHRFYYDYVWWLVRRVYAEHGRRLAARALLAQNEDVYFLVRSEIEALRSGALSPSVAAERIAVRRQEWQQTRLRPPAKFLRRGYVPDEAEAAIAASSRLLQGLAASAGQVTGRARVIYDIHGLSAVKTGDILVTRQTDPGWTPAFSRLGGLVLETGGVLAHGASLCREYGLPCVTAVENALSVIADGDLIALDGGSGRVSILQPANARDRTTREGSEAHRAGPVL